MLYLFTYHCYNLYIDNIKIDTDNVVVYTDNIVIYTSNVVIYRFYLC